MKHYAQLTQEQRYPMDADRKAGWNQTETAEQLRVDPSTIAREIRRGPRATGRAPWVPYRGFGRARSSVGAIINE
jgi:IS30 family transposase